MRAFVQPNSLTYLYTVSTATIDVTGICIIRGMCIVLQKCLILWTCAIRCSVLHEKWGSLQQAMCSNHSIGQISLIPSFSKCHRGSIDRSSTIANAVIFRLRSLSDHRETVSWGLVLWINVCPPHQSSASKAIRNSNSHVSSVKNQEKNGSISVFGIPVQSLNRVLHK